MAILKQAYVIEKLHVGLLSLIKNNNLLYLYNSSK